MCGIFEKYSWLIRQEIISGYFKIHYLVWKLCDKKEKYHDYPHISGEI